MQSPGKNTKSPSTMPGWRSDARMVALIVFAFACSAANCEIRPDDSWQLVFSDDGSSSWREKWFVEGDLATIENTGNGMVFTSGPNPLDQASHAVLWTNDSFAGDIKIEYDYTRLDDMTEATSVNILYIQATGTGSEDHPSDISMSSHLRRTPWMKLYFMNMNLIHISYATTGPKLSLIHISEPTRPFTLSRMPSSA